ncbi:hypothetical protein [Pyrodictium abyssi]
MLGGAWRPERAWRSLGRPRELLRAARRNTGPGKLLGGHKGC